MGCVKEDSMKKRMIALLLALTLLLPLLPRAALAEQGPAVSCGSTSVYPGNWAYLGVEASGFSAVASLDVTVRYDSSALNLISADAGYLLSGCLVSVNTDTPGVITLSCTALDGLNGSGTLLDLQFEIPAGTEPGRYDVTVAVGDAYDTGLQPVAIGSVSGAVTVQPRQETAYPFYFWCDPDNYRLEKEDVLTLAVLNNHGHTFVSADFTVEFDPELFQVENVSLNPGFAVEGAVYSVNTSIAGCVRLVYASNVPVNSYELFAVKLRVIADVDAQTEITVKASNAYHEDLSQFLPYTVSNTVTLVKQPEVADYPDLRLEGGDLVLGQQQERTLTLEAGAGVAAADFTLRYDPTVLRCVQVKAAQTLGSMGGMVVINENYGDGLVRFSYINEQGYSETDIPLVSITWEPLQSPQSHYQITLAGTGVVDTDMHGIQLEYTAGSGCIFSQAGVYPPTCIKPGYTLYKCGCGQQLQGDIQEPLGHSYEKDDLVCDRCGHTRKVQSIRVGSLPNKTEYARKAEPLDLTGGTVIASLDDGAELTLAMSDDMVSGFDNANLGSLTLTVRYGGCETTFQVTIRELVIKSVELIAPEKRRYLEGAALDLTGGYLKVLYDTDNAYTETVPLEIGMISGFDTNKPGTQDVTVSWRGYQLTFSVEVIAKTLLRLEILSLPDKLSYFGKRDALDVSGGQVKLYYDNGTEAVLDMTEDMVSSFDNTVAGLQTLTVTVAGKTATFQVEITAATVVFLDYDGTELSRGQYLYGETVPEPAAPVREADETFTYTFAGWDKPVVPCVGDTVYTAVYTPVYIVYTVVFLNADGSLISSRIYHYGDAVEIPAEPAKPAGTPDDYVFKGWGGEITVCTGNATYTALFGRPFPRGDLDQNGVVNDMDVEYLLWHLLFADMYPVEENVDYDGNGTVNDMDVEYLLWHLLFPDMYPL